IGVGFAKKKRRIHVGEMHLSRTLEIALRAIEVLGHHAKVDIFGAEDVADLPQRFLDADIAAGIAGPVVAGEEQLQFFAGRPALADAELPGEGPELDHGADPGDEKEIGHAPAPLAVTTALLASSAGQGFAGYFKFFAGRKMQSGETHRVKP